MNDRSAAPIGLGLDFGTEACRAVLVDSTGQTLGTAEHRYAHGQITAELPTGNVSLPHRYALQSPLDWIESGSKAVSSVVSASMIDCADIVGIGVDFTSCTMLPTRWDGTPLCTESALRETPHAWPKLWKHHGAIQQTERLNAIAKERNESFLERYGSTIGLEWFFPKLLETIDEAPEVAEAAEVWLEAGDWFVWQLVGGNATELPRSTCQAGYKGLWSREGGYGSSGFFHAVDPRLAEAVENRMPGRMISPGESAGRLCDAMAAKLGVPAGISVSAATIDAHAGVPGVGEAEPGTLVMVMGTSSCHMINATHYQPIPGVAGVVDGGILPGMFGYETGQAAVGDAFAWLQTLVGAESLTELGHEASKLPPGAEGVMCLDWMNGCRTPLMDGALTGAFTGLTLSIGPAHLYRALLEASAFGLRWIVDELQSGGIAVNRLVATGGLPHHNQEAVQIYADVLATDIEVHPSQQGPA
ncbi:MAG: ribulokinase, partial [Planctomycetota bacterium]